MASLAETVWIPAFAGMTGEKAGMTEGEIGGGGAILVHLDSRFRGNDG